MYRLAARFSPDEENVNIHLIRDLTDSEIEEYLSRKENHIKLRQRLSLLYINERNFADLEAYRNSPAVSINMDILPLFELNRLFMNYLSSAYALREHLKTHIRRDFGRGSQNDANYNRFLEALEAAHMPYAFYQDFRNFVQHCGFPIGNATRVENSEGISLHLTYEREKLLNDYNRWEKSGLQNWNEEKVDLAEITTSHHAIVRSEFLHVILAEYGGEVDLNESYFERLHEEARTINDSAVAVVVTEGNSLPKRGTVKFEQVPVNSLRELGLVRRGSKQ